MPPGSDPPGWYSFGNEAVAELLAGQGPLVEALRMLRKLGLADLAEAPQVLLSGSNLVGRTTVLDNLTGMPFSAWEGPAGIIPFCIDVVFGTSDNIRSEVYLNLAVSDDGESYGPIQLHHADGFELPFEEIPRRVIDAKGSHPDKRCAAASGGDVVRIEISGPDLIPLKLRYLGWPGGTSKKQRQDVMKRFLQTAEARPINLRVVTTKSFGEEGIFDSIPSKDITLGVIIVDEDVDARPDRQQCLELAMNERPAAKLAFGWHVLGGGTGSNFDMANAVRDVADGALLGSDPWSLLPAKSRGGKALRAKVAKILKKTTASCLSDVIPHLEGGVRRCQQQLDKLGVPRPTPNDQRAYLVGVASPFLTISADAVRGSYTDGFFAAANPSGTEAGGKDRPRRLRACVDDMNLVFTAVLFAKGLKYNVVKGDENDADILNGAISRLPARLQGLVDNYKGLGSPETLSLQEFRSRIEGMTNTDLGGSARGVGHEQLVEDIFRDQSKPWAAIAHQHVDVMAGLTTSFVRELLAHVVGADTAAFESILANIIDPFFDETKGVLHRNVNDLLLHYKTESSQHPFDNFRSALTAKPGKRLAEHVTRAIQADLSIWTARGESGLKGVEERVHAAITTAPAQEIPVSELDCVMHRMTAYYEVRRLRRPLNPITPSSNNF